MLITITPAFYFYNKYQKTQQLLEKGAITLTGGTQKIIEKVGKLIELPANEEPTVATVSDVEKVKNQPFFAKAKNGDVLLIYNKNKKAILYDPLLNKIVEVGPLIQPSPTITPVAVPTSVVTLSPTISEPSFSPTPSVKVKVYLYNGTAKVGLTSVIEKELEEAEIEVEIIDKDSAKKRDYKETLVIDLSGKRKTDAELLAKILKAEVSTLPAGETKPEGADILVIVGEDKK